MPRQRYRCLTLAFCLLGVTSSWAAAQEPIWVWGSPGAQQNAADGPCHFRKTFTLGEPERGRIEIACDNQYMLLVNNRLVGSGDEWGRMDRYDIGQLLKAGENTIEVHANNGGASPAGLVARVTVQAKNQAPLDLSTNKTWQAKLPRSGTWEPGSLTSQPWAAVHELGPLGTTAPWGNVRLAEKVTVAEAQASRRWSEPFELVEGDRVVFLGNTLIEREQLYGQWEAALTRYYPRRNITFRNLGWSGDTVFGHARARFGPVSEGFRHLTQSVQEAKPTVIFVAYGASEAHAGEAGLGEFMQGLNTLLAMLDATGAKIVLLSPLKHEHLGPPLPDPAAYNAKAPLYCDALQRVADERGYKYVDLFHLFSGSDSSASPSALDQWTDNGIHLSPYGYWRSAPRLLQGLGLQRPVWRVELAADQSLLAATGVTVSEIQSGAGELQFKAVSRRLPTSSAPPHAPAGVDKLDLLPLLRVVGLPAGKYQLSIDDQPVLTTDAAALAAGVRLTSGPLLAQSEELRQTIVRKDELYFHRYRPQNETYLFLFRKHEQGNNAVEIPQFDPLVAELEGRIAELRQPRPHIFKLAPVK